MKRLAIATLLIAGSGQLAAAESVRTFGEISYEKIDRFDQTTMSFTHFFADQSYNGVYDDFGYLNTDSSINGTFSATDSSDNYGVGGELFIDNLILGGSFSRIDTDYGDSDVTSLKVGYLFGDNLIVSAVHSDYEGGKQTNFIVEYNHELGGNDYLAFTASSDDEFDVFTFSPTYFMQIGAENFVRLGVEYVSTPNDDYISGSADYYLSPKTSIGGTLGEDDYSIRAKHYFTFNTALTVGYTNFDEIDDDLYQISLIGQF